MATIDNLNFKVILDDADFSARVKRDIEEARKLNVQLSALLSVRQQLSGMSASAAAEARRSLDLESRRAQAAARTAAAEERVRAAAERTTREHHKAVEAQNKAAAAAARAAREQTRAAAEADRMNGALSRSGGVLGQLAGLAATYFSVQGVTRFLGSVIRVTGEFEMQREALRHITMDVAAADRLFQRLQGLAVESPFTFSELTTYAKQLSAFSIPVDELYDKTRMLADLSAGLGVDMGRLILAFGQVRSSTVLRGQELRQFTEAGVPLVQKLAEQFGELEGRAVSASEVFERISRRMVSFEMVDKVLQDLTSHGGQFFDMQAVLSETLKGKVMKLKDAYEQLLFKIGEENGGFFHGLVDTGLALIRNYEDLGRVLKEAIIVFGIYKAAAIVCAAAQGKLLNQLKRVKAFRFVAKNPYALIAAGAAAAVVAVIELTRAQKASAKVNAAAADALAGYNAYVAEETSHLDALWHALEKSEKGTERYEKARLSILDNYGQYLSSMDKEALAVGNLAGVYERLTEAVTSAARERFLDEAVKSMDEEVANQFTKIAEKLSKAMDKQHITDAGVRGELSAYVSGLLDLDDLSASAAAEVRRAKRLYEQIEAGEIRTKTSAAGIEYARRAYEDLTRAAADAREQVLGVLDAVRAKGGSGAADELLGWQKAVNAALVAAEGEAAAKSGNMIRRSGETVQEYIERIRKSYKELTESIANASPVYQKAEIEEWKKDLAGLRAVARVLRIELEKSGGSSRSASDSLTAEQRRERDEINATVKTVEKLRDAYRKLEESVPEGMLGDAMKALFPDAPSELRDNSDYEGQLRGLSERLRAIPGEADAADRILTSLGEDATKTFTDAFAAAERFAEAVRDLTSKDFSVDGSGVAFKISKAVADLRSKNAKVDIDTEGIKKDFEEASRNELALKALREKYGDEFWEVYVARGEEALNELAAKEKEYNTKKTQEQIAGFAKEYVSAALGDVDMTELSQKTYRQLRDIITRVREELARVDAGDLGLSDDLKAKLDGAGVSLEAFGDAVKTLFNADLRKLTAENMDTLLEGAVSAAKGVSELADALSRLGDAAGDDRLAGIGETLKDVGGLLSGVADGFKSGGAWGAVAGMLTGAADLIINKITEQAKAAKAAEDANEAYAKSVVLLRSEMDEGKYTSVFGENVFGKLAEAMDKGRVALSAYETELSAFRSEMAAFGSIGPISLFAGNGIYTALLPEVAGMESLMKEIREQGYSVWGEDGAFNADAARAYLDANYDIDESLRKQLEYLLELKERWDEIQEVVDEVAESMVGSLAGDLTDAMLDNFRRVGDAVDDLDSAFENLGDTIARAMLQSFVQDELLKEFGSRFKDLFNRYAEGSAGVDEMAVQTALLADEIRGKAELAGEYINQMLDGFDAAGLLSPADGSSSSGGLSDGIKAVTEDTASLLASYVNGIRADVSHAKAQREAVLSLLRSAFPSSSPTILDHLARIQANTYETAESTRAMLSEFRGVLAPHDEGGSGVKVVAG